MLRLLPTLAPLGLIAVCLLAFRGGPEREPSAASASFELGRGPTIVLVHGLGSRIEHWFPTARRLARRHRVVLAQLPGHDLSPMPEPFSLERVAEALERLVVADADEPVVLVGHSVGGLVATALALEHPERVRGLVLVETALRPTFSNAERDAMLAALDNDYATLLRSAYTSFGRDSLQGAALAAEAAENDSTAMKRWIRLALSGDVSTRLRALEPPVLVILADRSWPLGESWQDASRALGYTGIARIEAVRLEGCGHFVMLDRPERVATLIEKFVDRLATRPVAAR